MAFVDVAYNVGVSAFCGSIMARRTNAGDMVDACNALMGWNKITVMRPFLDNWGRQVKDAIDIVVKRKVLEKVLGLTRRRQAERELWLKGGA